MDGDVAAPLRRRLGWGASIAANLALGYCGSAVILALVHVLAFIAEHSDESWFAWSGSRVGGYDDGVGFALGTRIALVAVGLLVFWLANLMIRAKFRPTAWQYWSASFVAFLLPSVLLPLW